MKRPAKKMALYEVIGKKQPKSLAEKALEPLKASEKEKKVVRPVSSLPEKSPEKPVRWANKPKLLQFNAGMVEMSVPYPAAVAVVLVAFIAVLMAFRFGQATGNQTAGMAVSDPVAVKAVKEEVAQVPERVVASPQAQISDLPTGLEANRVEQIVQQTGDAQGNNIVIQALRSKNDLEPVKDYFAEHGIAAEIRNVKNWYYLVTVNKYETLRSGSDGDKMLKRIIELGAGYEAPPGYETFRVRGKTPFQDAYGMRFED